MHWLSQTSMHTHTFSSSLTYVFLDIQRERERERERKWIRYNREGGKWDSAIKHLYLQTTAGASTERTWDRKDQWRHSPKLFGQTPRKETFRIKLFSETVVRASFFPFFVSPPPPAFLLLWLSLPPNRHPICCQFSFSKSCLSGCHRELGLWEMFSQSMSC